MNPQIIDTAIQAAQIQADATIRAAYLGGIGIGIGIIFSWWTALHIQKNARVAETRRNIYLDLVESFSNLVYSLHSLKMNTDIEHLIDSYHIFSTNFDKAMFVCETKTKEEMVKFNESIVPKTKVFIKSLAEFNGSIEKIKALEKKHSEILMSLKPIYTKIDNFSIESPMNIKILNAFDLINSKLKQSQKIVDEISDLESSNEHQTHKIFKDLDNYIQVLSESTINIIYLLRLEIGIKTDVEREKKLIQRLNAIN